MSIYFFCKSVSVNVYYTFLDYLPLKSKKYTVSGSIMKHALHDALAASVLTVLGQEEKRNGNRKEVYKVTIKSNMSEEVHQHIG